VSGFAYDGLVVIAQTANTSSAIMDTVYTPSACAANGDRVHRWVDSLVAMA
jgi:hypothetical protein